MFAGILDLDGDNIETFYYLDCGYYVVRLTTGF